MDQKGLGVNYVWQGREPPHHVRRTTVKKKISGIIATLAISLCAAAGLSATNLCRGGRSW